MEWTATGFAREIYRDIDARYQRRTPPNSPQPFNASLTVEFRSRLAAREELSAVLSSSLLVIDNSTIRIAEADASDSEEGNYCLSVKGIGGILSSEISLQNMAAHRMTEIVEILRARSDEFRLGDIRVETSGPFIGAIRPVFNSSWSSFFDKLLYIVQASRSFTPGPKPQWHGRLAAAVREYKQGTQASSEIQIGDSRIRALTALVVSILSEVQSSEERMRAALAPIWKRIRYLGPLRHQPQRFYQFDDTGGIDIGVSGEFTVQVLALEAQNKTSFTGIENDATDLVKFTAPQMTTLQAATNYWLAHMGLPPVAPDFLRQSLYGLKVGQLGVALPDVGFGVSQVLPVIVEALRASSGDTVILEQPEIHLHPAVQGALADFLLCRTKDGVRFIVETHSEYLVKRLCRRIAEGSLEGVQEMFNIIFVEPSATGNAKCTKVALNEYGEIVNWPPGFFDQQEDLFWTNATLKRRLARQAISK